MPLSEGKAALSFTAYRFLAATALSAKSDFAGNLFSHLNLDSSTTPNKSVVLESDSQIGIGSVINVRAQILER